MRKKLVVLNDFPIYPINHGGKIRIYNIYSRLSERFDVTYLSYSLVKNIEESRINDHFTAVSVPKGAVHRRVAKHAIRFTGFSIDDILAMLACGQDRRLCEVARKHIGQADAVIASQPYLYSVIEKYAGDRPIIYESHNVEYLLKRSIIGGGPLRSRAIDAVRRTEGALVKAARQVFATSADDMRQLADIYSVSPDRMHLSPNGTDVHSYDGIIGRDRKNMAGVPVALFIGSGHPPNAKAADAIVKGIAPQTNDVQFTLCGSVCHTLNRSTVGKNVRLAYEVSDDEKFQVMGSAAIALNPMLDGSGTNLKMLDYMAAGLPIITTPIGARGLELENGRHAIICNIDEFPAKIKEVLGDRALFEWLRGEGRRLAEAKYDWDKIAQDMADIIENTAQ